MLLTFALGLLPFDFALAFGEGGEAASAVVQLVAVGPGAAGKNRECAATGFFINAEGFLLSNAHVVDDARRCLRGAPEAKIVVKFPSAESLTARAISCDVVTVDEVHDLAVLKTERAPSGDSGTPLPYARLDLGDVAEGTPVVVTGHPGFSWRNITQAGKVVRSGKERLGAGSDESSEVLVVNVALKPGNSGSPVYREGGEVVGIVVQRDATLRENTVAVSIRYAVQILDRRGIRWHGVAR